MNITDRDRDLVGKLLTWIGGLAAIVLVVPIAVLGCAALGIAAEGADPLSRGLLQCRNSECVDQWQLAAGGCAAAVTVAIVMGTLVIRSSRRSLQAATVVGLVIAAAFMALSAYVQWLGLFSTPLLFVAAIGAALGIGSALRLGARRHL